MDRRIIESARVMNVGSITMIKDIVYPYVLPTVLRYLPSSLSTAFMCLTGAEMIGASSGLGFFIRKYAEYANYTNVLAGIIFMGLVVTMLIRFLTIIYILGNSLNIFRLPGMYGLSTSCTRCSKTLIISFLLLKMLR